MVGSGIGGALGSAAGLALAPETGGLSLAIPAATGAIGAEAGNALTGSKSNPLMAALMGGIGGGIAGGTIGGFDATGAFGAAGTGADAAGTAASGATDAMGSAPIASAGSITSTDLAAPVTQGATSAASGAAGAGGQQLTAGTQNFLNSLTGGGANEVPSAALQAADPTLATGATGASPSLTSQAWDAISKNPLTALKLAGVGATGLGALLAPKPAPVSAQQNAANVMATNPSFNASLPKYSLQNTGTPYAGNWNTYGQSPQAPMYNGQFQALKEGGKVHGYADGGAIPQQGMPSMPQQQLPIPPMPPQGQPPVNHLALAKVHQLGMAIGTHLREHGYNPNSTPDGKVQGKGGGQDDLVPAKLSQDEYIIPADVTSQLGDGSSNAGAAKLDQMVKNVRQHKATKSFPPKAKNPLSYIPKGNV